MLINRCKACGEPGENQLRTNPIRTPVPPNPPRFTGVRSPMKGSMMGTVYMPTDEKSCREIYTIFYEENKAINAKIAAGEELSEREQWQHVDFSKMNLTKQYPRRKK